MEFNLDHMAKAANYNEYIVDLICCHTLPGSYALDFGAGIGTLAKIMEKRGNKVDCIEIDNNFKSIMRSEGLNVIEELKPRSYDIVYSSNVLEHIRDDYDAVRIIFNSLKPSGKLMVYVPAFMCLYGRFDQHVGHERRYSPKMLRCLLRKCGFDNVEIRYADSIGFWATLLYKFLPGRVNPSPRSLDVYCRYVFPVSSALDHLFKGKLIGKNLFAVAEKTQ